MKCPFCNADLPDSGINFCSHCGNRIDVPHSVLQQPANPGMTAENSAYEQNRGYNAGWQKNFNMPAQSEFAKINSELGRMSVMQIVCLVFMFIPLINIVGGILLLVILIMSLSLTDKVRSMFERCNYPLYASMVSGIKGKCIYLLCFQIISFVGGVAAGMMGGRQLESFQTVSLVVLLVYIVMAIVAIFFQVYCFCRLYTVKSALQQISAGIKVPGKPGGAAVVAVVIIVGAFVGIAVIGILAAIALPAYAKYTARAKFTEVSTATAPLKQQVELCYFDTDNLDRCSTGNRADPNRGERGWDLSQNPRAHATGFVDTIEVDRGTIRATAVREHGLRGATLILTPVVRGNGGLDWQISPQSTCISADLC